MTLDEIKDYLVGLGMEDAVVLENPDYAEAFIGVSDEDRAVYDHRLMVKFLMDKEGMTEDQALDFIDYNTIRALPYMGEHRPIIFLEAF